MAGVRDVVKRSFESTQPSAIGASPEGRKHRMGMTFGP
jgi:hypothetical protein